MARLSSSSLTIPRRLKPYIVNSLALLSYSAQACTVRVACAKRAIHDVTVTQVLFCKPCTTNGDASIRPVAGRVSRGTRQSRVESIVYECWGVDHMETVCISAVADERTFSKYLSTSPVATQSGYACAGVSAIAKTLAAPAAAYPLQVPTRGSCTSKLRLLTDRTWVRRPELLSLQHPCPSCTSVAKAHRPASLVQPSAYSPTPVCSSPKYSLLRGISL